jgi:23S rRNA (adenine2503-C2)-methyltransferase
MGLQRNLEAWEIVEQVRVVRARLSRGRVHGVVFQGMGEFMAKEGCKARFCLRNPE